MKGSYGDCPVAVKLFRRASHKECCVQEYRDLREELTIMSHLSHPHVVTLLGVCLKPLCMVMPLAPQVHVTLEWTLVVTSSLKFPGCSYSRQFLAFLKPLNRKCTIRENSVAVAETVVESKCLIGVQ